MPNLLAARFRPASDLFELAASLLGQQSATLGGDRRPGRNPQASSMDGPEEQVPQALFCPTPVGGLHPVFLSDDPQAPIGGQARSETLSDLPALHVREMRAREKIEQQRDARGDLVDVLSAGTARTVKTHFYPGFEIFALQVTHKVAPQAALGDRIRIAARGGHGCGSLDRRNGPSYKACLDCVVADVGRLTVSTAGSQ